MSRDLRSVGELLVDSDLLARELLMDVTGADARAVVRSWPGLVRASAVLWEALPDPARSAVSDAAMRQVTGLPLADRFGPSYSEWPRTGPGDPRMQSMAANLERAAALVERHHELREGTPPSPAGGADIDAARARMLHTL